MTGPDPVPVEGTPEGDDPFVLSPLGRAAVGYAQRGWFVFPLASRDKIPAIAKADGGRGFQDATTDVAQVSKWWQRWPDANIGLWPGPSKLLVLDLDGPPGEAAAVQLGLLTEPTLVCKTGRTDGGRHLYFHAPPFPVTNASIATGIDVRGHGGYVVLPPSVHPSGQPYTWHGKVEEIRPTPPTLIERLRQQTRVDTGVAIPEGARNNTLTRLAGRLLVKHPIAEAGDLLWALNLANCSPPLRREETDAIVRSLAQREAAKPGAEYERLAAELSPSFVWLRDALADPSRLEPPHAEIPYHAWRGRISVLHGREKTAGKSSELGYAVAAASRGDAVHGTALDRPITTLMLGIDEPPDDTVARLAQLGAHPDRVALRHHRGLDGEGGLLAALEESKADVLVVDSLTQWAHGRVKGSGDSEGWRAVMMDFKAIAREVGVAVVLIHHDAKGEGGGYRDSTEIGANADVMIHLSPVDQRDRRDPRRRLDALGRRISFSLTIEYDPATGLYTSASTTETAPALERGEKYVPAILQLLADSEPHGLTHAEWKRRAMEVCQISKPTFDRARRLACRDFLALAPDNTRSGWYRITSKGEGMAA